MGSKKTFPRKAPKQADVARRAGVSVSTISRALTDKTKVKPETYDRVARAVESLKYRKQGRVSASLRTKTVAVIVPTILDPFFCVLLHGIDSVAKTYGYNILFLDSDNSTEIELKSNGWA